MLPPVWVRRLLVGPLVVVMAVAALISLPITLLVMMALTTTTKGRWRPVRFAWFLFLYLGLEALTLIALFFLWIATGFGMAMHAPWSQRTHYALLGWLLRVLEGEATRVLNVRLISDGATPDEVRDRPLVVLARHAGAGDSFLLVDTLINWYEREPRIVLKSALQWDPAVDVLLNRLPTRFVGGGKGSDSIAEISALASDLDDDDAFVIFPEGGNFTPFRRAKSLDWLRQHGMNVRLGKAEQMRHVLAPREAGTIAALTAAIDADVLIVAHTGLEHLDSLKAMWRYLPMDTEIRLHWEHIPAEQVPRDPEEISVWLYDGWLRIDVWVEANRPDIVLDAMNDPDLPPLEDEIPPGSDPGLSA